MKQKILVIGAHPDDLDFGTSGTMLKWAKQGAQVYYLICTNGDKGGTQNNYEPEEIVEIRKKEQQAAAEIIGVKEVIFLDRSDGELEGDISLKKDIVRIIRQIKPEIVFSFDPANRDFDGFHLFHIDHRITATTVFDAVYPAAENRLYFPDLLKEGLKPHKVQEMYFFGTNKPNVWIDISDVIDRKIEVLRCHKSQFDKKQLKQVKEYVLIFSKQAASGKDFEYAEAFRKISFPF